MRLGGGLTAGAAAPCWRPVVILAAAAWAWPVLATGTQSQDRDRAGLQVLASTAHAVRFSSGDLVPVWTAREVRPGLAPFHDLTVAGYTTLGEPGQVRTPRAGAWVVVPPGTRPQLRVVEEAWEPAQGRRLMVEAVPVLLPQSGGDTPFVSEILVLPGEPLPPGVEVPEGVRRSMAKSLESGGGARNQAATLGAVSWWRGRRVVAVQVVPVRHDGQGHALDVLRRGTWEIAFVPEGAAGAPGGDGGQAAKLTARGDDRFGQIFLNPELLETQPTEGAFSGAAAVAPPQGLQGSRGRGGVAAFAKDAALLAPEVRLAVRETKLQRVTAARLRERNLLPQTAIREDQIRLYQRRYVGTTGSGATIEIEVPILMVGEGDLFDGDDYFVFYGLRLRDDTDFVADLGEGPVAVPGCGDPYEMNNKANFYWLAAAEPPLEASWARMQPVTLPAATGAPLGNYRRNEHHEEQVSFRENNARTGDDRVYQNAYTASEAKVGISPLWAPDPDGTAAQIRVGYTGFNIEPHLIRFDLLVDNVPVLALGTQINLASMVEEQQVFSVPASVLAGGSSAAVVMAWDGPVTTFLGYLDWVTIAYDARYQAVQDRLTFNAGAGSGQRPLGVEGFTSADLGLIEITDPRRPQVVTLGVENLVQSGTTWTLSIMPDQTSGTRAFCAVGGWTTGGVPEFSYVNSSVAADPRDPAAWSGSGPPDLLVVTHPLFEEAIGRWVAHRQARAPQGLAVHLVRVQDLYDAYSGGLRDPWALKRFTAEAIRVWGSWSLMLVGDANENALELGVGAAAQGWATDWVPAHYHVQRALTYQPELLAADKWYATSEAGMQYPQDGDYPGQIYGPWEMYVGRFPCNSVDELNTMIDKVITVETTAENQTWRRRSIFFADDSWSNGYGLEALSTLTYRPGEEVFASSTRDSLAVFWREGSPVTLEADTLFLAKWLDPESPPAVPGAERDLSDFWDFAETLATPPLLAALNGGGLLAFYQGHANQYVLCSEYWIQDQNVETYRQDTAALNNAAAPWLFFGLGCHISDWAQSTVGVGSVPKERSLSEKFMIRQGGGASATYGSSGYEYITANKILGEKIFRRWMFRPPVFNSLGPSNVDFLPSGATAARSRWVTGELLWAAEADLMALLGGDSTYREMVAQYTLLGDPLMVLDAGPPVVEAVLRGNPDQVIPNDDAVVELRDIDGGNVRILEVTAKDEAGIDRLVLTDSQGADLTGSAVAETLPAGATDHQEVAYRLELPVRPFAHQLIVDVFDTGAPLPTDRHYSLVLDVPMDAVILSGGQPHDPSTFAFVPQTPVAFDLMITSGAALGEQTVVDLTSGNLAIGDLVVERQDAHTLHVRFTATAAGPGGDVLRSVELEIDDVYATSYVLQEGPQIGSEVALGRVFNFPNPMAGSTRFVFETGGAAGQGRIRVFSVAGRPVARIPFVLGGLPEGIVEWDGRDGEGDELGNGTYLYRVELEQGARTLVSEMQRLVVMR